MPSPNTFEAAARARKVTRLLALVPAGNGPAIAARLASWTPEMREVWALRARVNPPSDQTWRDLCAAVRARTEAA